jgi:hypothetical protein
MKNNYFIYSSQVRVDVSLAEGKIRRRRFLALDRDLLRLGSQLLLHSDQRIGARRQALNLVGSIDIRNCEKWVGHDVQKSFHPWMIVAADGDHEPGITKHMLLSASHGRLRNIESGGVATSRRHNVDVVHGGIAVTKLDRLPNHRADHMRDIPAAFLIEHRRHFGSWIDSIAQAIFDIHKNIGEPTIMDDVLLGHIRSFRTLAACRVLRHINHDWSGRFAL